MILHKVLLNVMRFLNEARRICFWQNNMRLPVRTDACGWKKNWETIKLLHIIIIIFFCLVEFVLYSIVMKQRAHTRSHLYSPVSLLCMKNPAVVYAYWWEKERSILQFPQWSRCIRCGSRPQRWPHHCQSWLASRRRSGQEFCDSSLFMKNRRPLRLEAPSGEAENGRVML